jgi:hypothetical protein
VENYGKLGEKTMTRQFDSYQHCGGPAADIAEP